MIKRMISSRHSLSIAMHMGAAFAVSILLISAFTTRLAGAQSVPATTGDDLRATVQSLLLTDPRAANLPQKEFDGMVDALVAAAQEKGLSAHDISWHPQPVTNFSQSASVGEVQACDSLVCMVNEAFGFSGPDMSIAIWFGICSAIMILVIGGMIEVHRRKHLAPSIKKQSVSGPKK